jgi:hypothetical protein
MTLPTSVPTSDDLDAEIAAERTHLAESRAALRRMRERAQHLFSTGDTVAGDGYSAETLGRTLSRRVAELTDDPKHTTVLRALDLLAGGHRAQWTPLPHRTAARDRRRRRTYGAGLAGPGFPVLLPGQRETAAGCRSPAPVRFPSRGADWL